MNFMQFLSIVELLPMAIIFHMSKVFRIKDGSVSMMKEYHK